MAEQEQWNNGVPPNYVERRMAQRRAEKERRARLAREMRQRASGSTPHSSLAQGATASLRPPVYVPPTKTIPQRNGVAGIALRKTKRKARKTRKANSRKSRK